MPSFASRAPGYLVILSITVGCLVAIASPAQAACNGRTPLAWLPLDRSLQLMNLARFFTANVETDEVKVAIFDQGFAGFTDAAKGVSVPIETEIVRTPAMTDGVGNDPHGFGMAQIFYQAISNNNDECAYVPKLYLYKALEPGRTFSKFRESVQHAIRNGMDLVLMPQVLYEAENFDGTGVYSAELNRLAREIPVLVSAGNAGRTVWNAPVRVTQSSGPSTDLHPGLQGWVALPGESGIGVGLCRPVQREECVISVALTWNSVSSDPSTGSDKDLDLFVYQSARPHRDEALLRERSPRLAETARELWQRFRTAPPAAGAPELWRVSERRQSLQAKPGMFAGSWEVVREIAVKRGAFFIRVGAFSNNFTEQDRLRVTVWPAGGADPSTVQLHQFDRRESLPGLADNPNVITVGALDVQNEELRRDLWGDLQERVRVQSHPVYPSTASSRCLGKPEVLAPGTASFDDRNSVSGTSAAVMMAGAASTALIALDRQTFSTREGLLRGLTPDRATLGAHDPVQSSRCLMTSAQNPSLGSVLLRGNSLHAEIPSATRAVQLGNPASIYQNRLRRERSR